nr:ribonuclease H-like domain-containing protein [Tanacetum cinerariifolium]
MVSNKRETLNSTVYQSKASVLKEKTVNAVNDGSNLVCVSCGKDVFMLSHDKCVARYALSVDSRVKRALFTSHVAAKSRNLGATSVVAKSRFVVAKTPTTTNKVIQLVIWIVDSGCSKHMTGNLKLLGNSVEKFMGTVRFELVDGLLKFKYDKDHLCSSCEQGKSKKTIILPKLVPSTEFKLEMIHMDLCGTMRVESINSKQYILVIVDDYSRYTWVFFLRTKDEAPDMNINFINKIQRNMRAQVLKVRSDNGTEFKNKKLRMFYEKLGIVHHTLIGRTPQQNGVFERRNCTLVEASHSLENSNSIPSKEDLDNLFGPLYEEYYVTRSLEVLDNSTTNTLDQEDTHSSSLIIVEENEAPQIVTSSEEPVTNEPKTPNSNDNADESVQKDVAKLDGNTFINLFATPEF